MNWNLVRSFLAVAEAGSLSAAARRLGLTQPTLGRHVQELEEELGVAVFDRHGQGLRLTPEGAALLSAAETMAAAADELLRRASGRDAALEGVVRVSANDVMGLHVLPRAFAAFRRAHPGVRIELVVTNAASSLTRREADVALRLFRPTQTDLVARRLPDLPLGFYAHRDWLARHGPVHPGSDRCALDLIGFDEDRQFIDGARRLGFALEERHFVFRCDTIPAQMAAVCAGMGVGVFHVGLARRDPALVRVLEEVRLPPLELWLVCHRDVQHNRRIRAVMDFLAAWLGADPHDGPPPEGGPHGDTAGSEAVRQQR